MTKEIKKELFIKTLNNYIEFQTIQNRKISNYFKTFQKDFTEALQVPQMWDALIAIVVLSTGVTESTAKEWMEWFFIDPPSPEDFIVVLADRSSYNCSKPEEFYEMLVKIRKIENIK